ncbi:hypothetical protein Bhyg_14885 [Pseudolycoriella hygida]|uniref:Uncharacterized protein n=1 Tax=Pseudolycoriella hygida TaxID=35572 RepID=A0A9Q0RXK9_9DIPT|nr:hypothetical protein Bhyg_14885 [Pseudolycoriella hygida]
MSSDAVVFHLQQFSVFYTKFSDIAEKLFQIFGFQVLLTLAAASAFTLSSLFYVFDVIYEYPNLTETFKNNGTEITNALVFTAIHITELFSIISAGQTIETEIERSFHICYQLSVSEKITGSTRDAVDQLHVNMRNKRPKLFLLGILKVEKSMLLASELDVIFLSPSWRN